jgi:CubicO group peptidase (beta-lactamase class C family)
MNRTIVKIGAITIGVSAIAYSTTFYIPQFQSLGKDFFPSIPEFTSQRIPDSFSELDGFHSFDQKINQFLDKWGIVGASVAIAKDDKLIYAKGYGFSNKETQTPVESYNLFRGASVSKLVTAVGIMKLIEKNELSLESKVFGKDGILNDSNYLNYVDKRVEEITIHQLLEHSAGWTGHYGDHLFMPTVVAQKLKKTLPVSKADIIEFALMHRMHFQPGSYSSYSNLGYMILGEVIAKVTGEDYEEYIKKEVLFPLGIYDMCIGGSHRNEQKELEVCYYEPDTTVMVEDFTGNGEMVLRSYGGNDMNCLGAAGGWIASATDLMKLMLAINGNAHFADILSKESIVTMVTPETEQKSPLGWRKVNENEWIRTGTLASTSAIMVQRKDGLSYVFVINTGSWKGADFTRELERCINQSLLTVQNWPERDLFKADLRQMATLPRKDIVF